MKDYQTEYRRLADTGASIRQVAGLFGLTIEEAGLALHYANLTKVISTAASKPLRVSPPSIEPRDGKTWCDQCQYRVTDLQAATCTSEFCKARLAA